MYIADHSLGGHGAGAIEFVEPYPLPGVSGFLSEASSQIWVRCNCGWLLPQPLTGAIVSRQGRALLCWNCPPGDRLLQCFLEVASEQVAGLKSKGEQIWVECKRGNVSAFQTVWPNETLDAAVKRMCAGGQGVPQLVRCYVQKKCSQVGFQ